MLELSMKEAQKHAKAGTCWSCGKPETSIELHSCGDPKCNKALRPIHRWVKKVLTHLSRTQTPTYIGYSA
jgi:hypothetical protein